MVRTPCVVFLVLAAALPVVAENTDGTLAARLAAADRSDADRARDAGRKPGEVLAFLGIEPGMKVLDAIAAGGWYSEV
ncbi:MAG: methyltransferase, partial [Myxococcota bacterium]